MTELGDDSADYPGRRFGLPAEGSGSVAGWGRRLAALLIDWALSFLAAGAFFGQEVWNGEGSAQWAPLITFALEAWVLTTLLGSSAGQLILRIVIRRTSGAPLDALRTFVRTLLICLVIPAVVYNRDQQGLHDLAVDSVALRR
ncbi:MAG: RDD family protein [Nocardioidaceae bacterium]